MNEKDLLMLAIVLLGMIGIGVVARRNQRLLMEEVGLLLLQQGESYGLQLIEASHGKLGNSIYPVLRLLEEKGLVESREGDPSPERGGRPRIYYKLTAKGRAWALDVSMKRFADKQQR